jgi:F-box/leucine-rich repeat protein 14
MSRLAQITTLTSLDLCGPEITDTGLAELRELRNLTHLTLSETRVTPAGLANLQQALPGLLVQNEANAVELVRKLRGVINGGKWGGVDHPIHMIAFNESPMGTHRNLFQLVLNLPVKPSLEITDSDLRELKGLRGQSSFDSIGLFECQRITDEGVRHLTQFKHLKRVYIRACPAVTGAGFQSFRDIETLTHLDFEFSETLVDTHMKEIAQLKYLTILSLNGCSKTTDAGIAELKQLTKLTWLDLSASQVSGVGLRALSELKNLEVLGLQRCPKLTDADMPELEAFNSVASLHLTGTQITDAGIKSFRSLPKLIFVDISSTKITNAGLAELKGLQNLTGLDIQGDPQITDEGLMELKVLKNLTNLNVAGCTVTDAGCKSLQDALPKLKISR